MPVHQRLAFIAVVLSFTILACAEPSDGPPPLVCEPGTVLNEAGDACVPSNGCLDSPCHADATCTDTNDGYTCKCNEGFEGDGTTCSPVEACAQVTCDANATCTDGTCSCNTGYDGDGTTCTNVDECANQPCDENATCTDSDGSYACTCNDGFEGDGSECTLTVFGELVLDGLPDVTIASACVAGTVGTTEAQSQAIPIALSVTGGTVYSDTACETPITEVSTTQTGVDLYVRSDGEATLTLTADSAGFDPVARTIHIAADDFTQDERADAALVVYNANDPEAYDIAVYYAAARGIADERLCAVTMPRGFHASAQEVLGARTTIVNDCFCAVLGPNAPSPCDVSNLEAVVAALPITHLAMIRGLPARMTATGWPTDNEDPSVDFYLSYLLANDADIFAEDTKGNLTLNYPYVNNVIAMSPALAPKEHGYFAITRVQAITAERTLDLIDRTLASEAKGLQGNIVSETTSEKKGNVPGQYLTSTFSSDCLDYLSHEPFAFDSPESSWPYDTCRWGSTGSTAEGSAKKLMPGMVGTTIPRPINVGFFIGKEPFSEPKDNNHSAFYDYNNMLRWRHTDAECLPECDDFETAEQQAACQESSTDYFQVINTDCVGVAPGFMGQQLRSYPVGYYGFIPQGWWAPGGGATEQTPPTIRDDGAFQNELFTDPYYAHFGNADVNNPNEDTCTDPTGGSVPCPERVAVNINRKTTLATPIELTEDLAITIRVRYRNQGSPGASLRLQLYANNLNSDTAKLAGGGFPTIDLSETHDTWQTAEFEVFMKADVADTLTKLRFYLNGSYSRKIRGWVDIDAVEIIDTESGQHLMPGSPRSFAALKDTTNAKGESAADVIDRMNGIAYWGSSSHHLTGGWSFHSHFVAKLLFAGRTLGEATSTSGAKAGLVYGDPLYRGFSVKMYRSSFKPVLNELPLTFWKNTPEDARTVYINTLHGTDNNRDLQWELASCSAETLMACQNTDWKRLLRGQGAVRDYAIDLADHAAATDEQAVFLRIRAWPANDPENHLSDYGYVHLMDQDYEENPLCVYDFNGDTTVNVNDYYKAVIFSQCTEDDLKADYSGDGKVTGDDVTLWNFPPDDIDEAALDLNGDGTVNFDDLTVVFESQCGQTDKQGNIILTYDFDGDGDVDDDDMAKIKEAMGTTGCLCTGNMCP